MQSLPFSALSVSCFIVPSGISKAKIISPSIRQKRSGFFDGSSPL